MSIPAELSKHARLYNCPGEVSGTLDRLGPLLHTWPEILLKQPLLLYQTQVSDWTSVLKIVCQYAYVRKQIVYKTHCALL